jgi:hypothetical protein
MKVHFSGKVINLKYLMKRSINILLSFKHFTWMILKYNIDIIFGHTQYESDYDDDVKLK